MTIQIKHAFTSLKGDGGDATLVRPSNWNAAHTFQLATGKLVGRLTAGAGDAEEIALTAYMADLLGSADAAALAAKLGLFTTGDVKFSLNATAATGWIAYASTGTLGKTGSGASILASALAQPLYELVYNAISDTFCPVSGGRTGNSANDFNAGKTLQMPIFSGRTIVGTGAFPGGTTRLLGQPVGEEAHALVVAEIPTLASRNASQAIAVGPGVGIHMPIANSGFAQFSANAASGTVTAPFTGGSIGSVTGTTAFNGNNDINVSTTGTTTVPTSHNNMQPSQPLAVHVKL